MTSFINPMANENQTSSVTVVIGAQWGDEGKGKLVDLLAENADVVCRCQGGNNANHTIVSNNKTYRFHLLPSGIIHPQCMSVIGNGVVVHIPSLLDEIAHIIPEGSDSLKGRLLISDKAHIVFDFHQQVDGFQEKDASRYQKIGTTKKGIGPTYSSKVTRNGIRMIDLIGDFAHFSNKFRGLVHLYRRMFPNLEVDIDDELEKYKRFAEILRPYVCETVQILDRCLKENKNILIEGANAALLDIDFGTYPYVTSSNCSVGGVSTGLGIPPTKIGNVIGVVKAYTTRLGDGPFPTELQDGSTCNYLQMSGNEMAHSTNKKSRCGWLDLFALKYSDMINGYSAIALSKLDVLDDLAHIQLGIGYSLNGRKLEQFPSNATELSAVEVEYLTLPGWKSSTRTAKCYNDLPLNARNYVEKIQEILEKPIRWIGVGENKESLITLY